jgi:hypothetical protein
MKMIHVLWVIASLGIAGIATAVAHKPPPVTVIQKTKPTHNVDRLLKADKEKPEAYKPQANPIPTFKKRRYWYA